MHSSGIDNVSVPDRNLTQLGYVMLFFAVFLSGLPALIAIAIAYARRDHVSPLIRSHHSFQIWVFWVGFGLALLTAAAALVFAIFLIAQVGTQVQDTLNNVPIEPSVTVSSSLWLSGISAGVLFILTGVWLAGASAYGFFRLASGKPIRQSQPVTSR